MSCTTYWLKEELYFSPPAQLKSSTRIQLRNRKIQQMVFDIGCVVVMAERIEGYFNSIYFLSQWSYLKLVLTIQWGLIIAHNSGPFLPIILALLG